MTVVLIFVATVLLSGWYLGYALAKEMNGKEQPTPKALLISLLAVAAPTIMAFALTDAMERSSLLSQFRPQSLSPYLFIAIIAPLSIALAGHLGGILTGQGKVLATPTRKVWTQSMSMIAITLLWGLLEEIGWRGYLVPQLARLMPGLSAAVLVGVIWGIWHAPQMFYNQQLKENFRGRVFLGMGLWTLQCIVLGTLLGWLQIQSGSFLFPALAHALVNFFGSISDNTLGKEKDGLFAGTSGVFACFASVIIIFILRLLM